MTTDPGPQRQPPSLRQIAAQTKQVMDANSHQHGGDHYRDKAIQPWDYIAANGIGYMEGNIIKYVSRWRDKNGVEDLRKAMHYLQKLIEIETQPKD
jgi:hypothetical protein